MSLPGISATIISVSRHAVFRVLTDEHQCTIASKINVTPKGAYMPISKLLSILAEANLRTHNKLITQIKFITMIKFHYRVLQLTGVLLTISHIWG